MNLYLPVEVKNRELHAKLLLAKHAAEHGFNVILGRKNDLNELVARMPPGIYFGLGAFENFRQFFARLKARGFVVVVNEEEGLVTYSDSMYIDMRVSRDTLAQLDELFTWGDENQRVLSTAFPEFADRFKVTGNPRFELLKAENRKVYAAEMDEIRRQYGRYVLICTSFSAINHFDPKLDYLASLIQKKTLRSAESIENFKRYCEVKKTILADLLQAIPRLAALDDSINIVVRPHPSENMDLYRAFARQFPNVHVDARFSVHPWIIAADALIHHYCTTSIEALAAGTPRFALRSARDPLSEKEVPFGCSSVCVTVDELLERVAAVLRDNGDAAGDASLRRVYARYVANIDDHSAAEAIVARLASLAGSRGLEARDHSLATRWRSLTATGAYTLRQGARRLLGRHRKSVSYIKHKFDGLSLAEVKQILASFSPSDIHLEQRRFAGNLINIYRSPERPGR